MSILKSENLKELTKDNLYETEVSCNCSDDESCKGKTLKDIIKDVLQDQDLNTVESGIAIDVTNGTVNLRVGNGLRIDDDNRVELDGEQTPPEVAIQDAEPTGGEVLWISPTPGEPGTNNIDWNNVINKPAFTDYFNDPLTPGYMVRVKADGTGYEYFDQVSLSWENIENKPDFTNWFAEPITPGYFVKAKADGTGYEYVELILDWNTMQSRPSWTYAFPEEALQPSTFIRTKDDGAGFEYTTPKSEEISYNNPTYPTVKAALDKLLYVPIVVSLHGGSINEVGSIVSSVSLDWTINKDVIAQTINSDSVIIPNQPTPTDRTIIYGGLTIVNNTNFTIYVNDGTEEKSASTSVLFRYKRYWGVSANPTLDNSEILSLSKEFATTRNQTRVFDCSGGKYFYIIYPKSFGYPSFKVGGLSFTDMDIQEIGVLNDSGTTVEVYYCRVNNIQTGSAINVEVL